MIHNVSKIKGGVGLSKKRIVEIDILRGISISLVVMAHTEVPDMLNDVLRTFRMPLFFLLSGYLFNVAKYYTAFGDWLKSRVIGLLLPYFTACFAFYALWFIRERAGESGGLSPSYLFAGIFAGNGDRLAFNTPLWFLVCLFCAELIFWCGWKLVYRRGAAVQTALFFSLSIAGYAVSRFAHLPWSLDVALVAQLFMFAGYRLHVAGLFRSYRFSLPLLACFVVLFGLGQLNETTVDMNHRAYGNVLLFLAGGLAGSFLLMQLVYWIKSWSWVRRIFSALGKESLMILVFHMGFAFVVLNNLNKYVFANQLHLNWVAYTLWGIGLSYVAGLAINKIPVIRFLFKGKRFVPAVERAWGKEKAKTEYSLPAGEKAM
ncbi:MULTISPECIES: acyltransferase family protein [unclassified Paenibacillus]|uniref:acyltransferase family protein n=1 Tax=Paenibacillus sp. cl123 TaxID=1761875 RepID=UPI00210F14E4|nr:MULTISPECIES: acyltransferase [unclassified Paenibacillus]